MHATNITYPTQDTKSENDSPFQHHLNEAASPRLILKSMLLPDEKLLQVGKVSSGIYWKTLAMLFLSVITMLILLWVGLPSQLMILIGVALFLKVSVMGVIAYLRRHYLLLAATDQRVIIRYGILNLEVIQMRYSKIESSEVFSTIPGRFLNYAGVIINGTGGRVMAIPYIVNALEFRKTVTEILISHEEHVVHVD
jgi:membrane protein YdbS with pleckstrin-like domain